MKKSLSCLAWLTDIHLNFLPQPYGVIRLGEKLAEQEFDAAIVTGDISECPHLYLLEEFQAALDKPVFFVMGNHDYYRGSFAYAEEQARSMHNGKELFWLSASTPIKLTKDSCLIGQEGLYDARCGKAENSRLIMNDFLLIEELVRPKSGSLIQEIRNKADDEANKAYKKLKLAAQHYKNVYFATHYPPFREASLSPERKLSDGDWAPFFVSTVMGKVLSDIATEFPEVKFTVLCGHTHTGVTYQHLANLVVRVGDAVYGEPSIMEILEVP